MKEDEATREAGQDAATQPPLEGLQKTLHHIEAIKHFLDVSGTRPEPLELTLRNLEKLLDKGQAQVRDALNIVQKVKASQTSSFTL